MLRQESRWRGTHQDEHMREVGLQKALELVPNQVQQLESWPVLEVLFPELKSVHMNCKVARKLYSKQSAYTDQKKYVVESGRWPHE